MLRAITAVTLALVLSTSPVLATFAPCCCVDQARQDERSAARAHSCCQSRAHCDAQPVALVVHALPGCAPASCPCLAPPQNTTPTQKVSAPHTSAEEPAQLAILPAIMPLATQAELRQASPVSPDYPSRPAVSVLYSVWLN